MDVPKALADVCASSSVMTRGDCGYMVSVMEDERARTADRIEAGKWLANRGFGTAPLVIGTGLSPEQLLADFFSKLSLEDLQTMKAIPRGIGRTPTTSLPRVRSHLKRHRTLASFVASFLCRLQTLLASC